MRRGVTAPAGVEPPLAPHPGRNTPALDSEAGPRPGPQRRRLLIRRCGVARPKPWEVDDELRASVAGVTRDGVDELDQAVIHALQVDGRAPFRRIGEALGVSDQTVARRFGRLSDVLGLRVLALADPVVLCERQWVLRVRAAPEAATEVAEALARRADTSWISLCSTTMPWKPLTLSSTPTAPA
ncbi:Lrp/AsnC family transcriptional regulator [Streptomyces malaysiensis]|uniref:Lrp/AsnC family transcriptional regulator n=1 Tax=Streptomyces malaysiensis TaxID=92644 RepID=UPI00384A51D5